MALLADGVVRGYIGSLMFPGLMRLPAKASGCLVRSKVGGGREGVGSIGCSGVDGD